MQLSTMLTLKGKLAEISRTHPVGRVVSTDGHTIEVTGLENNARMGDRLELERSDGSILMGDVLRLSSAGITMLPDSPPLQVALSNRVRLGGQVCIAPHPSWLGRVIDPYGTALDGSPLISGPIAMRLDNEPPPSASRKPMGPRLQTGFHLFNTMLPVTQGQRIGIFAGSGVGKSTLLADLLQAMEADVVVLALVGERSREINHFTQSVLGAEGLKRAVVIASSADSSPTARWRCSLTAMTVSEFFRDSGMHVLLFVDSITRFAEAHREIAVSAGEFPSLRGFPPSTSSQLTKLTERAGPGMTGAGDITSVFNVLVAGSDLDEPIADMMRGVLDGHIILDRNLADRGRFPAVNILKSVSRSLPRAADSVENDLISKARKLLSRYQDASALIESGLYTTGSDLELDYAISFQRLFDVFCVGRTEGSIADSFSSLRLALHRCGALKE